ncbi:MAG: SBBP repeat-containing protein [Acidobacteriota bacterium]
MLAWNTFLGNNSNGEGHGIAVDATGQVYVAAGSDASWGSPVRPFTGGYDAVVVKLSSDGSLAWNTFLGGVGFDYCTGVAVDASGNVYVVGNSSAAWGSPIRGYTGSGDLFVAKLAGDGSLIWNTFLGGGSPDAEGGIATGPGGSVCVSGASSGTWGSPVRGYTAGTDGFAAMLGGDGSLVWNTFLGGGSTDYCASVAVDVSGNVGVSGASWSTWGSPIRGYTASTDGFVAKLLTDGSLAWNTFLGGGGGDLASGMAADPSGNFYVAGPSSASWGSPVRAFTTTQDIFAAKVAATGTLVWNTFLGGSANEFSGAIAVDGSGNSYVVANTSGSWGSPVRPFTAMEDAWAAKLDGAGSVVWTTFLGGTDDDPGYAVAVDRCGNVYVTGDSYATWGSPVQPVTAGFENIFAAKIASSNCPIITSIRSKTSKPGAAATIFGFNFSADKSKDKVRFGKYKADVSKASTTSLKVRIPRKSKKGPADAYVTVNGVRSNTVRFQVK